MPHGVRPAMAGHAADSKPLCTVCTVALDRGDDGTAFVAVSNPRLGLLLAYVFPGETFPWTALWYENGGSAYAPYDGKTVAWGIEFGTCALPLSRIEMLSSGPLLGRRRCAHRMKRSCRLPADWHGVARIARRDGQLIITERDAGRECE